MQHRARGHITTAKAIELKKIVNMNARTLAVCSSMDANMRPSSRHIVAFVGYACDSNAHSNSNPMGVCAATAALDGAMAAAVLRG